MENLKFSIIIPVYNVFKYLGDCLDSVVRQDIDCELYEIIIVDDCSPYDEKNIIDTYIEKYSNIKYIRHDVNKRQGGARNTGMRIARGEYIMFLDADDCLKYRNTLSILLNYVEIHSSVVLRSASFFTLPHDTSYQQISEIYHDKVSCDTINFYQWRESTLFGCYAWSTLYKRIFLIENNLFFRENVLFEDTDWVQKTMFCAENIDFIDFTYYGYRQSIDSTTRGYSIEAFQGNAESVIETYLFFEKLNIEDSLRRSFHEGFVNNIMGLLMLSRKYSIKDSISVFEMLNKRGLTCIKSEDRMKRFLLRLTYYVPYIPIIIMKVFSKIHVFFKDIYYNLSVRELVYYFLHRLPSIIKGKYLLHNLIKVHWGRGLNNFGDCLSPDILKYYGLTPVYVSSDEKADLILAGSILQWLDKNYSGYIVGTGGDDVEYNFPNAQILAVRGKYTLRNIAHVSNENIILADPGLLVSIVFPEKVEQIYDMGIIPHFVDWNTDRMRKWNHMFKNNKKVLFINPLRPPKDVIKEIKSCRCIVSSSLHGLIVADAYHIPNVRFVDRMTMPTSFYDYKFDDYYSSIGIEASCLEIDGSETFEELMARTTIKPIDRIEYLKSELDKTMQRLVVKFKK